MLVADKRDAASELRRTMLAMITELNSEARARAEADRVYDNLLGLKSKADMRPVSSPNAKWQQEQLRIQLDREAMLLQRREAALQQRLADYHVQLAKFQETLLELRTLEARAGLTSLAGQLGELPPLQLDVKLPPRDAPLILPRRPAATAEPALPDSMLDHSQAYLPTNLLAVSGQPLRQSQSLARTMLNETTAVRQLREALPKGRPPLPPGAASRHRRTGSTVPARGPVTASTPVGAAHHPIGGGGGGGGSSSTNTTMHLEDLAASQSQYASVNGRGISGGSGDTDLRHELARLNESISHVANAAARDAARAGFPRVADMAAAAATPLPPTGPARGNTATVSTSTSPLRQPSPPTSRERRARSLSPASHFRSAAADGGSGGGDDDDASRTKHAHTTAAASSREYQQRFPSPTYDSAEYWRAKWALDDARRAAQSQRSLMDIALYESSLERAIRR